MLHAVRKLAGVLASCLVCIAAGSGVFEARAQAFDRHVVLISADGLRADALTISTLEDLPALRRMLIEGAATLNARTDYDYTVTLPNHVVQLTGRRVTGDDGHNWTSNSDPQEGSTLHTNRGAYVASIFDVVHDAGRSTAAYVSKSKFSLLEASYDGEGSFERSAKIDRFYYSSNTAVLVDSLVAALRTAPAAFTFLHLRDLDRTGHTFGWTSAEYDEALVRIDRLLGEILSVADERSLETAITLILTSDHGGSGRGHGDPTQPANFTIPFIAWGAGVSPGADLYTLNPTTRRDPGTTRPSYAAPVQPVRNGDAANLAASLLGLPDVPGSTINVSAALAVGPARERIRGTLDVSDCRWSGTAAKAFDPMQDGNDCESEDEAARTRSDDAAKHHDSGFGLATSRDQPRSTRQATFILEQNYPNPFAEETQIAFTLHESSPVRLIVFDLLGRPVARLADGSYQQGRHVVRWSGHFESGKRVGRGVYIFRLETPQGEASRILTMLQ